MNQILKKSRLKLVILLLGLVPTLGVIIGTELPHISFVPQVPANTGEPSIEKAVKKTAQRDGAPSTQTIFNEVKRVAATGTWAFGIVSIPDPSKKDELWTRLWLARKTKSGWVAATDFTPTFISWVQQAPKDIVSEQERKILGGSSPQFGGILAAFAGDASGNFSLPWKPGDSWNLNSGPHGQVSEATKPWNSLDLAGGDQKVLAATGGLFYRTCWNGTTYSKVEIRQSDKWTTSYYHLNNTANIPEGTYVQRGTYLGETGTTTGCGGSATGRHVHFSISYDRTQQAWNGREISGWTIYEGGSAYDGRAEKDGKVVYANASVGKALLYNPKNSIVNVGGKCLDVKSGNVNTEEAAIGLWLCNVTPAQQWKFVGNSIRNIEGKCLDVKQGQIYKDDQPVWLYSCNGTPAQQWTITNGQIRNVGGKCLDVKHRQINTDGADIQLYTCNGTDAQKWSLVD
jgi:hypothetical protein